MKLSQDNDSNIIISKNMCFISQKPLIMKELLVAVVITEEVLKNGKTDVPNIRSTKTQVITYKC